MYKCFRPWLQRKVQKNGTNSIQRKKWESYFPNNSQLATEQFYVVQKKR